MARRGPKAKTAANSPAARGGAVDWRGVEPSAHLSGAARAEFLRLVELLDGAGTLGRTDPRLVELYAVNYDLLCRARDELDRDGLTQANAKGTLVPHPMIAVLNSATIRLRGLIADLGLTPATSRHSGEGRHNQEEGDNPWAGLLSVTGWTRASVPYGSSTT